MAVVLDFLLHMFHVRQRAALTVAVYAAALADPLLFGFGLVVRGRAMALFGRVSFYNALLLAGVLCPSL